MPTIYDVAAEAGVSIATVSRVLRGYKNVSDDARARVLAAADLLEYRPDPIARALAGGGLNAIGLVFPENITHPFCPSLAQQAARRAADNGYDLVLQLPVARGTDALVEAVLHLERQRIDGLLLCAEAGAVGACAAAQGPSSPPLVAVGCLPVVRTPLVTIDEEGGAYTATRHLLELGHKRVAFLSVREREVRPAGREHGYVRAMTEAGLEPLLVPGDLGFEDGRRGAQEAKASHPDVTGLVAFNDAVALGALRGLAEIGLRAPDDVSVVGFDNVALSRYSVPSLTTVDVPVAQVAERAVSLLLALVADSERSGMQRVLLPPGLIVRESTAPVPCAA